MAASYSKELDKNIYFEFSKYFIFGSCPRHSQRPFYNEFIYGSGECSGEASERVAREEHRDRGGDNDATTCGAFKYLYHRNNRI